MKRFIFNKNFGKNVCKGFLIFLILIFSSFLIFDKVFMWQLSTRGYPEMEIALLSPQNVTYTTTSIQLIFTLNTEASWIGYSLDFQENVTISGNETLFGLAEGLHNIIVYANDTSGFMAASERVYFTLLPVHDISVANISVPFREICSGEMISLNVTVRNKGTVPESFNVTVYYNNTVIETKRVSNLTEGSNATLTYSWNTTALPPGTYTLKAESDVVAGETNVNDNVLIYGSVKVYPKPLVYVKPSILEFKVEQSFEIGVWIVNVTNLCHFEFNFSYNPSLLYIEEVLICDEYGMFLKSPYTRGSIQNDAKNGVLYVCLTQSSEAIPVNGSGQLAKIKIKIVNAITYSWKQNATNYLHCNLALIDFKIGLKLKDFRLLEQKDGEITVYSAEYWFKPVPGDLNLDGVTDIIDLCGCAKAFGKTGESPFDLNGDEIVNEEDFTLIIMNFCRTKP
jgi:hypothetical protein